MDHLVTSIHSCSECTLRNVFLIALSAVLKFSRLVLLRDPNKADMYGAYTVLSNGHESLLKTTCLIHYELAERISPTLNCPNLV